METQDPKTQKAADPQEPVNTFPFPFPRRRMHLKGIIFALLVIAAGVFLLASNMGMATSLLFRPILFSWQVAIIVLALFGFISSLVFRGRFSFGSLFVMGAAFFLLIPRIGEVGMTLFGWTIPAGFRSTYWPVLLIFAGVIWLLQWFVRPRTFRRRGWEMDARFSGRGQGHMHGFRHGGGRGRGFSRREERERLFNHYASDGGRDFDSVFGSGKHIVLDPQFKGGRVNAMFGEVTLDLRKTALPENKNTLLEINVVFGNAVVIVPESWNVILHMPATIAGAFIDKREPTDAPTDMTRTLEIEVHSVFSGGELRN